jgi:transcriptional regulator with XRE-family HTH domain
MKDQGHIGAAMKDQWESQMEALGAFIRSRRKLANLSLRQLAERTRLSNPYLSQIERGLHQPSVRVIRLIADALNISAETLLTQAGLLQGNDRSDVTEKPGPTGVQESIEADDRLTEQQKAALTAVYHSMLKSG